MSSRRGSLNHLHHLCTRHVTGLNWRRTERGYRKGSLCSLVQRRIKCFAKQLAGSVSVSSSAGFSPKVCQHWPLSLQATANSMVLSIRRSQLDSEPTYQTSLVYGQFDSWVRLTGPHKYTNFCKYPECKLHYINWSDIMMTSAMCRPGTTCCYTGEMEGRTKTRKKKWEVQA